MRRLYIVSGYGVPENIKTDGNYQTYLRLAFNIIYRESLATKTIDPVIVLTGGRTDMVKPYRRTEAGEMEKVFRAFMTRPSLRPRTKTWKVLREPRAISSPETLLFSSALLRKRGVRSGTLTIFVEETRKERIVRLVRRTVPKTFRVTVYPIDFDASANRYLDPAFLEKKNALALRHDLWALRAPANMAEHHRVYGKRLAYLRKAGSKKHVAAVKKWWEEEMKKALRSEKREK